MALPMAPGERIAITMFMEVTPFACVYEHWPEAVFPAIDIELVGSRAILEVARPILDRHLARFQPRPLSPKPSQPSSVTATVSSSLMKPRLGCTIVVSMEMTMSASSGRLAS